MVASPCTAGQCPSAAHLPGGEFAAAPGTAFAAPTPRFASGRNPPPAAQADMRLYPLTERCGSSQPLATRDVEVRLRRVGIDHGGSSPGPRDLLDNAHRLRGSYDEADFLPPLRPAATFCAWLPPLPEPLLFLLWLLEPPDPLLFPPRLEAPGEFAIAAARDLLMPFLRSPSYCLSFLTLGP
jgi:hypothetical protein